MLGWFKKKFGKKTENSEGESETAQSLADGVPPLEEAALPAELVEIQQPAGQTDIPLLNKGEYAEEEIEEKKDGPVQVIVEELDELSDESALAETSSLSDHIELELPEATKSELEQPDALVESFQAKIEEGDAHAEQEIVYSEEETALPDEETVDEPVVDEPAAEAPPVTEESLALVTAPSLFVPNQEKPASKSMFKRLQERMGKTKESLVYRLDRLFLGKKEIDQDLFEQLEEILITADLGVSTTMELLDVARKKVKRDQLSDPLALKKIIRDQILAFIQATDQPAELVMPGEGPFVIMVVGVNGVGKTTTIGKIAAKFMNAGQTVLMVAADTFRAAAINQLRIWGERVGVEVIAQNPGADPSSVVFEGLEYGVAHQYDVILIDTAGRLHTSVNLMAELKKIKRVIGKKLPGAPHEIMLVLDATTGQNGISQVKFFNEAVGISGLTLTKLDGTAKGGIVANVCRESRIPVRFIGIGEKLDDLRDFDAREFVDALFAQ